TPKDLAELRRVDVHPVSAGARVVIPREINETNGWPWIERPRPLRQLPPWPAVLATTRRMCARTAHTATIPTPRLPDLVPARGPATHPSSRSRWTEQPYPTRTNSPPSALCTVCGTLITRIPLRVPL